MYVCMYIKVCNYVCELHLALLLSVIGMNKTICRKPIGKGKKERGRRKEERRDKDRERRGREKVWILYFGHLILCTGL